MFIEGSGAIVLSITQFIYNKYSSCLWEAEDQILHLTSGKRGGDVADIPVEKGTSTPSNQQPQLHSVKRGEEVSFEGPKLECSVHVYAVHVCSEYVCYMYVCCGYVCVLCAHMLCMYMLHMHFMCCMSACYVYVYGVCT